jgi:hypothetical protein
MTIRSVACNNLELPYARVDPCPASGNPVVHVVIDKDLGREGFTYRLRSGQEGTIHIEQVSPDARETAPILRRRNQTLALMVAEGSSLATG